MTAQSESIATRAKNLPWQQAVAPYQYSDIRRSCWQMLTSIGPYFIMWYLTYRSLEIGYWLTIPLAIIGGLFGMRVFIIFHDCGHGSFFKSRQANDLVGIITGIIVFTPYYAWRHSHAVHHASSGDLDRRGAGDIWTLTYDEYKILPLWKRILYRVYRNPFFMFIIGPILDFAVLQRLPTVNVSERAREKNSVTHTNLALMAIVIVMSLTIGLDKYLLVQIPILAAASTFGVWLFYVQHQYENVYWERHQDWDYATASLYGSSFVTMPRILQWFTGNIGFHHIHHLSPRIPNYRLEECHYENPMFHVVETMTLRQTLKSLHVRIWDEDHHKMIGFHKPDEATEGREQPAPAPGLQTPGLEAH